ncbi:hypothetical protein NQ317_013257 [Molorchus minor]|uniref:Dynein intermediate chain 2, ciliary n=1 Tax=Molorchus minor TaxID=1323400 RepID=A0ABQ9JYW1_9CUCU|nr:hypothetical protein NQ317_013257 [Molorchus minor]
MPPTAAIKSKQGKRGTKTTAETDDLDEWKKSKQLIKPKDQLELSDAELKEMVEKQLSTVNPQIPDSLVQFSFSDGEFVPIPPPGSLILVFHSEGTLLYKDSQEARKQLIEEGIDPDTYFEQTSETEFGTEVSETPDESVTTAEEEQTEDEKPEGEEGEKPEGEEGAQGEKPAEEKHEEEHDDDEGEAEDVETQETQTIPPPMANFTSNVNQWIIYDGYQQDWEQQQREKELERERREKDKAPVGRIQIIKKSTGKQQLSEIVQAKMFSCWRVLERMVNLNTYDDIAKDFRYWDDPADEFREEEGTLLPLWKFSYNKTKKHVVTDLEWNPYYYDLFAVCFGHVDYTKPMSWGAVCLYTLKNPSFPDYICTTASSVMCVDIHPKYPYMILLGLYDGSIEIFNIQETCKEPAHRSNNVTDKHRGIVWEVKWVSNLPDGELNFYSVSIDGKVNHWIVMENTMVVTTIITLFLDKEPVSGPDGTLLKAKVFFSACASCVKFHPKNSTIFLVGTEDGLIYKCSTEYSSAYLLTYKAHQMPVYRIDFNSYNTDIFISCSGDWRIKIWEDNRLGNVTTLKLSPNLRLPCKAPKKQQHLDQWTLQCMKLDRILSLVREPVTLTLPPDTSGIEES